MKRNALLTVIMCVFSLIVLFGIFYLNDPDRFSPSKDSTNTESHISIVRYPVYRGEVKNTHTVSAKVISNRPEIYITEKTVEYSNKNNFIVKVALGDDVNTGDILCVIGGEEYISNCNAKVVDIWEGDEKAIITLLNYDNLYAVMQIEADKLTKIHYNTPVEVVINGQSYSSEIKCIGYEVSHGMVDVYVTIPEKVLPGSEINAVFTLEVKAEGLYVSANAVYSDGNGYFGFVETSDGYTKAELVVGEYFIIEENGNKFAYYEILSGISAGDTLIVESIDSVNEDLLK